ncbi:MAG TPA: hypothetical protein VNN10_13940 [Dehalococcoidia bacterium]|nr:hypothetical protein [Dehalococcoidia bacterium]
MEADAEGVPRRLRQASPGAEKSETARQIPAAAGKGRQVPRPPSPLPPHRPSRKDNAWQEVTLLRRPWRIDQHWWRDAVSRMYFRVAPEGGPPITIYQDLITGEWYRQEY